MYVFNAFFTFEDSRQFTYFMYIDYLSNELFSFIGNIICPF